MEIVGIIVIIAFFGFLLWRMRKDEGSSDGGGIVYPPDRDNTEQEER